MDKLSRTLNEEEKEKIINLYQSNISLREIERQTGYTRQSVANFLENSGIKTTKGNHYRKYFLNEDFFQDIDSEIKAYWLGFIFADGFITSKEKYGQQKFGVAVSQKDIELIEQFKKDIDSTYPITFDTTKKTPLAKLVMSSQKVVNDLKSYGCVEQKSLILQFPKNIPERFLKDFIRGVFDGDGCIKCYQRGSHLDYSFSIIGTKDMVDNIFKILKCGGVYKDGRTEKTFYLNINGNQQIIQVYKYLYKDASRFLKRKKDKFEELIMKYGENQGIKE